MTSQPRGGGVGQDATAPTRDGVSGDSVPEVLLGGIANAGAVVRDGDHVVRPANAHTDTIHALLRHLRAVGFDGAPVPVGVDDDGRERLEFVPGDVAVPPYPRWAQSDAGLASAARLLRRFHDASATFEPPAGATWSMEMADPSGVSEVIAHNDVCMENVVYRNGEAVALLDFDFVAPGRRVYDLACFARMCVPLDTDADAVLVGRRPPFAPALRLRLVADAYGLAPDRSALLDAVGETIERGGEFLQRRLDEGNEAFIAMVEHSGGMARFDRRRAWFEAHRDEFAALLG